MVHHNLRICHPIVHGAVNEVAGATSVSSITKAEISGTPFVGVLLQQLGFGPRHIAQKSIQQIDNMRGWADAAFNRVTFRSGYSFLIRQRSEISVDNAIHIVIFTGPFEILR